MGKIKMGELFLKERICMVMEDIKQLNIEKIDTDIERIKNGVALEEIFFKTNRREINDKLWSKQNELKLLISCVSEGIEYLTEILPQLKENFEEDAYSELEKLANKIIELANVEVDEETGAVC